MKTVSLSSGENKVVSFTDKPMDDPAAIVIQKKDKYTGNTIKGKKTLAGAQFTIKYYDGSMIEIIFQQEPPVHGLLKPKNVLDQMEAKSINRFISIPIK